MYIPYHTLVNTNERAQTLFEEEGVYGTRGVMKDHLLHSAVESISQCVFNVDLYPDIFSKTAHLWYSLARNHCFVNGNKRTALLAAIIFLRGNFYNIDCKIGSEELYEVSIDLASGIMSKEDLKKWIWNHSFYDVSYIKGMLDNAGV
ncbi:hypothetical protein BMT55_15800 [Listeria newyorkensis]|uniref:Fido domain-containing protein n=2 Tax=Listeria newyorkensis TaxID=1497681 RepID=A0ABX4XPA0_9LIST|nr:hypothetical protein BMT55_15800 [Listeria newyorkensis]